MDDDDFSGLQHYHHAVVRDLAWAIASPPLLYADTAGSEWFAECWYRDQFAHARDWLQALDREPDGLLHYLQAQKDRRLGSYFETLWAYWLEHSERYELIQRNLVVRAGGVTLGELDCIVRDRHEGGYYHWELAIKFYLGIGDTVRQENWIGPGKRDRLDKKVAHLIQHQCRLGQHPHAQALLNKSGIELAGSGVIFKGRLFYPHTSTSTHAPPSGANPGHLAHGWVTLEQLMATAMAGECFQPLVNSGWLASPAPGTKQVRYELAALVALIEQGSYRLPLQLLCYSMDASVRRQFVVARHWAPDFCTTF